MSISKLHLVAIIALLLLAAGVSAKRYSEAEFIGDWTHIWSANLADKIHSGAPQSDSARLFSRHANAPGYALTLTTLANFDVRLRDGISYEMLDNDRSPAAFQSFLRIQFGLALFCLMLVTVIAWILSKSWLVTGLTLVFAIIYGGYARFAGQFGPEIWAQTCMLLFLLCLVLAVTKDSIFIWLISGVFIGIGALYMPQFLVVVVITAIAVFALRLAPTVQTLDAFKNAALLLFGAGLVVVLLQFHSHAALLSNSIPIKLAMQHIERGEVAGRDGSASAYLVRGIPLMGNTIANHFHLNEVEDTHQKARKWALTNEAVFACRQDLLKGRQDTSLSTCLMQASHQQGWWQQLLLTPGLMLSGLWTGSTLFALLGLLHIPLLWRFSKEDQRFPATAVIVVPVLSLWLVNTVMTVKPAAYQFGLVFLYAYALSYAVGRSSVRRNMAPEDRFGLNNSYRDPSSAAK